MRKKKDNKETLKVKWLDSIVDPNTVPGLSENPYAIMGRQFLDVIDIYNAAERLDTVLGAKRIKDLGMLSVILDEITVPEGLVLDVYSTGNYIGSSSDLYLRRKDASIEYQPCIDGLKYSLNELLTRFLYDDVLEPHEVLPYQPDKYIVKGIPFEAADTIPSIFNQIECAWTEMGVWQMYLLSIAPSLLPRGSHACYGCREYVFSKGGLAKLRHLDLTKVENKDAIVPTVTILEGSKAEVTACYWNDWRGLCVEHVTILREIHIHLTGGLH